MDSLKTEKIRIAKQADVFITKTATQTLTPTSVVERVMNFHFRDLIKALRTHSSVEISGFGKFEISQNKLLRRLNEVKLIRGHMIKQLEEGRYVRPEVEMHKRIEGLSQEIAYLEERKLIDETKFEGYCRRMAQSLTPTGETEGENPADK